MSEPKGRSGKKPKYQIADIGGTDLTSEDISTERVLNFLIKGDLGAVGDNVSSSVGSTKSEIIVPSAEESQQSLGPETPVQDVADHPVKKSLSHLFERAGGSAAAKEAYVKPSGTETATVLSTAASSEQQLVVPETVSEVSEAGTLDARHPIETSVPLDRLSQSSISPTGAADLIPKRAPEPASPTPLARPVSDASAAPGSDLAVLVDRWKNLYRLKAGEIAALSTMFRMTHGEGLSECYVKMHKLAELSSLDYRYCQKVVRSLERLGWITKLQDYDATTQLGVLYRVNLRPLYLT